MSSGTTGAAIARILVAAGVTHAYTVPGESFLGLLDALPGAGIRVVAARHEGAASFMAGAAAHMTGRPAALLVTRAVGAANAAIGIHTAYSDSAPVIAFVGQVPRRSRGREAFQEVDLVATIGHLGKWAAEPTTQAELIDVVHEATRTAVAGRPGPVLVSLHEDLLDEGLVVDETRVAIPAPVPHPDRSDVEAAVEALRSARRPVILAGAGVLRAGAVDDLAALADRLAVPVIAGWRRPEVFDNYHPLYLGMTGYWAPHSVRERLLGADVLLALGTRLGEPTTFGYRVPAGETRWMHVDLDPRRPSDTHPPERAIAADAGAFLRAALAVARPFEGEAAAARPAANRADREAYERAIIVDGTAWDGPGVHPGRLVSAMQRLLPEDAIITTDAGNFAGWVARGYRFGTEAKLVGPTSGAMGYALPSAIAASLEYPGRTVVAVAGDGGLGMTMMDMETAVREEARIIVLCFDNQRYGTIRMWQERRKTGVGVATELGAVDFAAIARALGAQGVTVDDDAGVEPALSAALADPRSSVIHLRVDPRWVSVDDVPDGAS